MHVIVLNQREIMPINHTYLSLSPTNTTSGGRAGANGMAAMAMAVPVFSQTLASDQNFFLICVAG